MSENEVHTKKGYGVKNITFEAIKKNIIKLLKLSNKTK